MARILNSSTTHTLVRSSLCYGNPFRGVANDPSGDEDMVDRLMRLGRLGPSRKEGDEITREDMVAASKL